MDNQMAPSQIYDKFLFCNIFKVFRIAIQPGRFSIAFMAVVILFFAGWLMDNSRTVVVSSSTTSGKLRGSRLSRSYSYPTELHCFVADSDRVDSFIERHADNDKGRGVFDVYSAFCMDRFNVAAVSVLTLKLDNFIYSIIDCISAGRWALKYHSIYSLFFVLIFFVVFSIAGGAICRSASVQFATGQSLSIAEALKFSFKKYISFACVLLTPIAFFAIFGMVFILLIGLMANIPWAGEIILAVLFIIVLLSGLLMTFMLIGSAAGTNMMFGALGCEDSNTFDAFSRAFIYIYSKPWRYIFYCLTAAVYGSISYLFVRFFAFLMLSISRSFLSIVMWTKADKAGLFDKLDVLWPLPEYFNLAGKGFENIPRATESIAVFVIHLEILFVAGLVVAFAVSFYFSASSVIYSLMRKSVDGVDIDQVYNEPEDVVVEPVEVENCADDSEVIDTLEQPE